MKQLLLSLGATFFLVALCFSSQTHAQDVLSGSEGIHEAVPLIPERSQDIRNYMMLGSDNTHATNIGRTDVMLIVSVNLSAGTVAMLSLPRDLYVFVPGRGMEKVNTVFAYGESDEDTSGFELLQETVRHNLGISLDGYARVNFDGFRSIVDSLGGVDIAVDCAIQDWRLISPELDMQNEDNWELFTLPIGMHELDGDTALWYVRSRRTSSDFDRGRRHQIILRAVLRRAQETGLLTQISQVYPQLLELVDTNLSLDDMLNLLAVSSLSSDRIASYRFEQNVDVHSSQAPDGGHVQVPIPERIANLMQQFLTPPTELQIGLEQPRVEIVNASSVAGIDEVAAERLRWEGFNVGIGVPSTYQQRSVMIDLAGNAKDSSRERLQSIVRIDDGDVVISPQTSREIDFRVTLGGNYYACTHNVLPPIDSTPSP